MCLAILNSFFVCDVKLKLDGIRGDKMRSDDKKFTVSVPSSNETLGNLVSIVLYNSYFCKIFSFVKVFINL